VDVHALSLTAPMVYFTDSQVGGRLARAVNDAMNEAHTAYPLRFVGLATLPMQDPTAAVTELDRVREMRGIRGIYLGTNVNGRELSDPAYFPVYERCQAAKLPILLHPLNVIGANRLGNYYLSNFLGNPFDTAVAASYLVFGGVLDRFPKLEVCLPHAGGALPYLVGRLTHGQRMRPETKGVARRPFETYLKRFTYDTISHSPTLLRFLIELVGADRVMLGSDYCFDMGYIRPREIVEKRLRLSRADQRRIVGATAARLLALG
jgi:aminocarboxymuconate-semialdehyde decarboxylase